MSAIGLVSMSWARATTTYTLNWSKLSLAVLLVLLAALPAQAPNIMQWLRPMPEIAAGTEPNREQMSQLMAALPMLLGVTCCAFVYQVLFLFPLMSGLLSMALYAVRGEQARVGMISAGFGRYFSVMLTWLLWFLGISVLGGILEVPLVCAGMMSAMTAKAATPSSNIFALLSVNPITITLGSVNPITITLGVAAVAGLIAVCWLTCRTALCLCRCVDPSMERLSPAQCIAWSYTATRGAALSIFITCLLGAVCVTASVLLLGVGLVVVGIPLASLLFAALYDEIALRAGKGAAPSTSIIANADTRNDDDPLIRRLD